MVGNRLELRPRVVHDEARADRRHHLDVVEAVAEGEAALDRDAEVRECVQDARALRDVAGVELHVLLVVRVHEPREPRPCEQLVEEPVAARVFRGEFHLRDGDLREVVVAHELRDIDIDAAVEILRQLVFRLEIDVSRPLEDVLDAMLFGERGNLLDGRLWQHLLVDGLIAEQHDGAVHEHIAVEQVLLHELWVEIGIRPAARDERAVARRAQGADGLLDGRRDLRLSLHDVDQRAVDVKEDGFLLLCHRQSPLFPSQFIAICGSRCNSGRASAQTR